MPGAGWTHFRYGDQNWPGKRPKISDHLVLQDTENNLKPVNQTAKLSVLGIKLNMILNNIE